MPVPAARAMKLLRDHKEAISDFMQHLAPDSSTTLPHGREEAPEPTEPSTLPSASKPTVHGSGVFYDLDDTVNIITRLGLKDEALEQETPWVQDSPPTEEDWIREQSVVVSQLIASSTQQSHVHKPHDCTTGSANILLSDVERSQREEGLFHISVDHSAYTPKRSHDRFITQTMSMQRARRLRASSAIAAADETISNG